MNTAWIWVFISVPRYVWLAFLTFHIFSSLLSHLFFWGGGFEPPIRVSTPVSSLTLPYFHLLPPSVLPPHPPLSPSLSLSPPISLSRPSLSAEAHQGKQMLWLLFMFPLGLAFIQIIHRPCTVQTLSLNGLHWQLSQPYPRSDTQTIPQTPREGELRKGRGGEGGGDAHGPTEWTIATHWWAQRRQ